MKRKKYPESINQPLLNIAMWNIEGLTSDKVVDSHFLDIIESMHILSFVETWSSSEASQLLHVPNFELIASSSRTKHKRARRYSGGICLYAKCPLVKGIKALKSDHSDILWLKMDHSFFNFTRDLYIAIVYISPEYTTGNVPDQESVYAHLLQGIE